MAEDLSAALVRHVAAAVDGVCREHGGDADRTALAGALAARARCGRTAAWPASVAGGPGTAGGMTARRVKVAVNGEPIEVVVEPRDRLADLVRDAGLTGTHLGATPVPAGRAPCCSTARTVRSCLVLAGQCDGHRVTTIEALGTPDALHPVMDAFRRYHGLQCGFCTPGMVLTAVELLAEEPDPDEATVRSWLAGNVCRCTGYAGIVAAVLDAAASARDAVDGGSDGGRGADGGRRS